jgi:hypothetical protein
MMRERTKREEKRRIYIFTSIILMWTFERFPPLVTSLYNGCLRKGCFPKRWKRARIIP